MTPTEEKAKAKAEEIYKSVLEVFTPIGYEAKDSLVKEICIFHLDETIEIVNSIKGMGKIHKVSFLKKVKEYVLLQE